MYIKGRACGDSIVSKFTNFLSEMHSIRPPVRAAASVTKRMCNSTEEDSQLRRGPWTLEEDTLLTHYIACHGEGRWNMLAKHAGN